MDDVRGGLRMIQPSSLGRTISSRKSSWKGSCWVIEAVAWADGGSPLMPRTGIGVGEPGAGTGAGVFRHHFKSPLGAWDFRLLRAIQTSRARAAT
jgi:hypothetical protein